MAKEQTPLNHKPHISEKARQRPVRVIPADDRAEYEAGHLIGNGGMLSSNMILRTPGADKGDAFGTERGFSSASFGHFGGADTPDEPTGGAFDGPADHDGSFGAPASFDQ